MSSDKRSVSTDALETLGKIISDKEGRDAIHLAVENVIAGHTLRPGEHVGFIDKNKKIAGMVEFEKSVGIVDPFLSLPVTKGQRFWLVVYPRKITSLRHVWTHPEFSEESLTTDNYEKEESESEIWLKSYAKELEVSSSELMRKAQEWLEYGDYWCGGDEFEGLSTHSNFWEHYEKVTGKKLDDDKKESFFTCAC